MRTRWKPDGPALCPANKFAAAKAPSRPAPTPMLVHAGGLRAFPAAVSTAEELEQKSTFGERKALVRILRLPADYYQQFDADFSRDVPGEGYGGWKRTEIEIAAEHTAVVVLHAWDCGTREQYPGTHRACEYIPRSYHICQTVFPPLLEAVRRSPLKLFHVVSTDSYCRDHPGYQRTVRLAGPEPEPPPSIGTDPVTQRLRQFRSDHVFPGARNQADQ